MSARGAPSEPELLAFFETLSNRGRWGEQDERGTLNLITPEKRRRAAALVREGIAVSCAWDIDPTPAADHVFGSPRREMRSSGETPRAGRRYGGASEDFGLVFHGYAVTHLDALSHYFWDGRMYGDRPAALVSAADGATRNSVTAAAEGVTTRGVLVDVAAHRGVAWLEAGEPVFPDELDAALSRQGVALEPGDALLLRTGYARKKRELGPDRVDEVGRAGWHAACLPWLRAHDVALISADTAQDAQPCGYPSFRSPVHAVGIVAMGLWLLDNGDFEALASTCRRLGRFDFLFQVAPLRIAGGTGSPVNPIALF